MPIDEEILDGTVRTYVDTMSTIRGRRVHRLLMREFSRFDHVLPVTAEDGSPALVALGEDGSVAVCRTDGRGAAVAVAEWGRLEGATVTTSYDLMKDSLPIVSWTIWHPSFARVTGTLTVSGADFSRTEYKGITDVLRALGGRGLPIQGERP
jgi:hypothetical protein